MLHKINNLIYLIVYKKKFWCYAIIILCIAWIPNVNRMILFFISSWLLSNVKYQMVKCHFSRLSASLQAVKLFFRTEGLTAEFKAEFKLRTIAWALVRSKSFRLSRRRTGASGAESLSLERRVVKCSFTGVKTTRLGIKRNGINGSLWNTKRLGGGGLW